MTGLLILAAGVCDLAIRRPGRRTRWTLVLLWAATTGICTGLWISPAAGLGVVGTVLVWAAAARRPRWHLATAGTLAAAVAILCAWSGHPARTGPGRLGPAGLDPVWIAVLDWAAVGLFLTGPANELCRSLFALLTRIPRTPSDTTGPEGAIGPHEDAPAPALPLGRTGRWRLHLLGREVASVDAPTPEGPADLMGGGRLIGVLERVLIVILALAGMTPALAAVAAAKGIVRFPEISQDRATGAKAEEFLVGSLASWTIAAVGAAYLALG